LIKKKAKFEIEYQRMKKRVSEFEKKEFENHEQSESFEVFIESGRNTSNSNVSDSIVISNFIIFKKLLDSSIFIDEKNSNIKD
jgi:hypothetical protein